MKFSIAARIAGLVATFALSTALLPSTASAGSAGANLDVSATVNANCLISDQTLNLGNYDPVSLNSGAGSPLQVTDTNGIAVTCTQGHSVTLAADKGANNGKGGCTTNRALANGTNYLCYELYTDSFGGTVWGDTTTFGSVITLTPTTGLAATTTTIYAEVPGHQDAVYSGTAYTDTVRMTVNF